MREIRKSGSMRGSGRKALLRKCHLSLSTLPVKKMAVLSYSNYRSKDKRGRDELRLVRIGRGVTACTPRSKH
jgi:hypothetical protein